MRAAIGRSCYTAFPCTMSEKHSPSAVLPHALPTPGTTKLHGKRFILASGSPRRKAILETFVRFHLARPPAQAYLDDASRGCGQKSSSPILQRT